MVQGYPKKVNPCPSFGCSFNRCRFNGVVYAKFGFKADDRYAGSSDTELRILVDIRMSTECISVRKI